MKKLSLVSVVVILSLTSCHKHEIVNQDARSFDNSDALLYDFSLSSSEASWNEETQAILLTDTVTGSAIGIGNLTFKVKSVQKPVVEFAYEYDNKGLSVEGKVPKVDITSICNGTTDAGGTSYNYVSDVTVTSIPAQIQERQVPLDIHMILKDVSGQVKDTITFEYRPKYDNTKFSPVYLNKKYWAPINIGATAITGRGSDGDMYIKPKESNPWNRGTLETPVKSDSDPCPAGWRVPTKDEWHSIGTYGFNYWYHSIHWVLQTIPYLSLKTGLFSETLILPLYEDDDWEVHDQGDRTYYWSSTINEKHGKSVVVVKINVNTDHMEHTEMDIRNNYYYVYTRCIQE
ncbi:MAG: hypothetical protein PARBA_01791 [Parabacteroides sp.]